MAEIVDIQEYQSEIEEIDIFRYLNPEEMGRLLQVSDAVAYTPGETVLRQGEVSDDLFAVIQGSVDVLVKEISKEAVVVSRIGAGDVFGETGIFTREARTATVRAVEKTICYRIKSRNLLRFIQENAGAGNKLLLVIVLSLINKLKHINTKLAFENQSDIDYDYVDSLIEDFAELI